MGRHEVWYCDEIFPDGSPVEDEIYGINGHITGQHKGTPMQSADEVIGAYDVEYGTVRYGTMLQDGGDGHPNPVEGVPMSVTGTNVTFTAPKRIVTKGENFEITFTASDGYELPSDVTVKIGGKTGTKGTDYTFTSGKVTIAKAKLTGAVEIKCVGEEAEPVGGGGSGES